MAADPKAREGRVLADRYRLERHLGRGAMGDVYQARHVKVPRTIAVKILLPALVQDPKVVARFEREAELAGRLRHRNVTSVIDVGETDGTRFLVMEYAAGRDLGRVMNARPMEPERALALLRQIADGLAHAHAHDVVHRDLKPENVIVEETSDGELARIVDFGVAILRDGAEGSTERLTTAGLVIGTPHYMAPELAAGRSFDHRVDLFALGVIFYEMLTGVMPYGGSGMEVAMANIRIATPPMALRAPTVTVDPLLEALTRALMAKKPDARPRSAREVMALVDLIASDRAAAAEALGVRRPEAPAMPAARGPVGTAPAATVSTAPPANAAAELAPPPTPGSAANAAADRPPITPESAATAAQYSTAAPTPNGRERRRTSTRELLVLAAGDSRWPGRAVIGVLLLALVSGGALLLGRHRSPASGASAAIESGPAAVDAQPSGVIAPPSASAAAADSSAGADPTAALGERAGGGEPASARAPGASEVFVAATALDRRARSDESANAPESGASAAIGPSTVAPSHAAAAGPSAAADPAATSGKRRIAPPAQAIGSAGDGERGIPRAEQARASSTVGAPARSGGAGPDDASTVVERYQRIARALKAIADRRDMAADDLWQRYRRIRIQDALASRDMRAAVLAELAQIDRELERRFR